MDAAVREKISGVAAVFSGHDHCYERAEANGVRYFVSGGGGAPLYARGKRIAAIDRDAVKRYERVSHYLRVHVIGARIEVTAVRVDGTPIETIAWGDDDDAPAPLVAAAGAPPAAAVAAPPAAVAAGDVAAAIAPRRSSGGAGAPNRAGGRGRRHGRGRRAGAESQQERK